MVKHTLKILRCPDPSMVAENDHLQIFQNYEKLKKQITTVCKQFCLKFNFKYEYFLVKI